MPHLARACTVLLALILGSVGLAAPASADDYSVSVTSGPGVIYAACTDHPFNYSVTPPADASSWKIELTIQAPDGTSAGSVLVGQSSPTTGVATQSFCPSDNMPGIYTVSGIYEVLEFHGGMIADFTRTPVTPFTIDMRAAYLRASADPSDKTPRVGQKLKVKVQVTDERPGGGFFGTEFARVQLQRLQGSRWVGVKGATGDASSTGRTVLKFRNKWQGKSKFRVRAKHDDLGTVNSNSFTLPSHV